MRSFQSPSQSYLKTANTHSMCQIFTAEFNKTSGIFCQMSTWRVKGKITTSFPDGERRKRARVTVRGVWLAVRPLTVTWHWNWQEWESEVQVSTTQHNSCFTVPNHNTKSQQLSSVSRRFQKSKCTTLELQYYSLLSDIMAQSSLELNLVLSFIAPNNRTNVVVGGGGSFKLKMLQFHIKTDF